MVVYCCFPLGGFGFLDSGFPQQDNFVGGYFLLVLGCYYFDFSLSSWNYSTDLMDFMYSIVQKYELVERVRVKQN
jgi:hypothetical protein